MRDGRAIAERLGGHRIGRGWMFKCPCHPDDRPSASIREADGMVTCFRGCKRRDIYAALNALGLEDDGQEPREVSGPALRPLTEEERLTWERASYLPDADVVKYFERRGLTNIDRYWTCVRPSRGRVLAGCWPGGDWTWDRHRDVPLAYQITFLTPDCRRDYRHNVGSFGSGAVRLVEPGAFRARFGTDLGLSEGLETALSVISLYGMPTWAVLGSRRMDAVDLPGHVGRVHLFGDNDDAGRDAVARAVRRFTAENRAVVEHFPPPDCGDFNDLLVRTRHG